MTLSDFPPIPSPNVVTTKLADGEAVLLDLDTSSYIRLNRTATVIWTGIENGRTLTAIVEELTSTFDLDETHAGVSVAVFVARLLDAGLASSPDDSTAQAKDA